MIQKYRFRSKLVSLLRRLSPRLSRPGNKGSLQSSPTICPWVQVEYSTESIEAGRREESQESDASFQQELQLNELRKRMAGIASTSQVINNLRAAICINVSSRAIIDSLITNNELVDRINGSTLSIRMDLSMTQLQMIHRIVA